MGLSLQPRKLLYLSCFGTIAMYKEVMMDDAVWLLYASEGMFHHECSQLFRAGVRWSEWNPGVMFNNPLPE